MRFRLPWERTYNGKYKVEITDPDWIEPMDETLNHLEGEMQAHHTESLVEDLVSLLRARAVKAAHEVKRLRDNQAKQPCTVYAADVEEAARTLSALVSAKIIENPNGFLIIPSSLLKRDDRPT